MSTYDDIAQERQRISERLAKLDMEREKLAEQLSELETVERVLSRFGKSRPETPARRGRPPAAAASTATRKGAAAKVAISKVAAAKDKAAASTAPARKVAVADVAAQQPPEAEPASDGMPLSEATMRAVQAQNGATADDVRSYLAHEFGMQVRPNHLGMALQRHRRAGRLENRDSRWWLASSNVEEAAAS